MERLMFKAPDARRMRYVAIAVCLLGVICAAQVSPSTPHLDRKQVDSIQAHTASVWDDTDSFDE